MSRFGAAAWISVRRASAIATISILALGCARNADLEVTLTLPPRTSEARFAFVQFERPPVEFGSGSWAGTTDVDGTPLVAGEATIARFSILTESFAEPLRMRVRFCRMARCEGDTSQTELWFELEHPFYRGERTSWAHVIDAIPTDTSCAPAIVDRCAIQGCVIVSPATPPTSPVSFCRLDGTHFCERAVGGIGPDAGPTIDATCAAATDAGARDAEADATGGDR